MPVATPSAKRLTDNVPRRRRRVQSCDVTVSVIGSSDSVGGVMIQSEVKDSRILDMTTEPAFDAARRARPPTNRTATGAS